MNIQIFGTKKCQDTKKAERFFKERGIRFQLIDMNEKGMSGGEFDSVARVCGFENMINYNAKDQETINYIRYTTKDLQRAKLLECPWCIVTPVVRDGKRATLGYKPDVWKEWMK